MKNYKFSSIDELWEVNLTRSFVALTANRYERWEEYKAKLEIILAALLDVYSPSNFLRIGLRYIDVIKRSKLGLEGVNWRDLLNPYLLGIHGASNIADNILDSECKYEIGLSDGISIMRLITRLVKDIKTNEVFFVIDKEISGQARRIMQAIHTGLNIFRSFSDIEYLPELRAVTVDDGSFLIEWIFYDFRIGFSIELNIEESSWYLVTNERLGSINAAGFIPQSDYDILILLLINFAISNS